MYWIVTKFIITKSVNVTSGYTTWGGSSFELDFSESGTFSEFQDSTTLGRPIFHINDEGNGYFVWSGYRGQITEDSDHSIHYTYTDDFGESGFDETCVTVNPEPNNNPTVEFMNNIVFDELFDVLDNDPALDTISIAKFPKDKNKSFTVSKKFLWGQYIH